MPRARTLRRSALLAFSLLAGGAANDFGLETADGVSHFQPNGAFGAYLMGRDAAQRTDLDVAAEKLEAALVHDPDVPELATQAFLAAAMAGRPAAARLAAGLPSNPLAQLVLADRDARAGSWDAAEARFNALPQNGLTQVLRPMLVAWAQAGGGRTDAALATLAPLVDGSRYRGVMALHAAMIADLGGQAAEAARLYGIAQADYGPLNLRLGVILASWYARQGQVADAQATIRDLTSVNGDLAIARVGLEADVVTPVVRSAADGIAEAYLALAATLRQQNGIQPAQLLLRLALDMRPDFAGARLLLAEIQEAGGHGPAALTTLAAVAPADPLAAVVRLRQAGLHDAEGRSDDAVQMLDQLARDYPARPEPLVLAGDVLRRKSRYADAVGKYDQAIARLGTPGRANWPIFYERGIALERSGDWVKAESDFQYALQLAPEQPSVLNYLAYSWTEQGRNLPEARSMIERAAAQRPKDGAIIDSLGWVLLRQGDAAAALVQLERAVELQPEDAVITGHLGDALMAVGRAREAEFQWRRALILKPEPDEAAKITAKLAALPGTEPAAPRADKPAVP